MNIDDAAGEGCDDTVRDKLAKRGENGDRGVVFCNNLEDFVVFLAEIDRDAGICSGFFNLIGLARVWVSEDERGDLKIVGVHEGVKEVGFWLDALSKLLITEENYLSLHLDRGLCC